MSAATLALRRRVLAALSDEPQPTGRIAEACAREASVVLTMLARLRAEGLVAMTGRKRLRPGWPPTSFWSRAEAR